MDLSSSVTPVTGTLLGDNGDKEKHSDLGHNKD